MLENLIENTGQVVSESERVEQNLISRIEEVIESAEQSISESLRPDVYLVVGPYEKEFMDRLSRGERLIALSIARSVKENLMQDSQEDFDRKMEELRKADQNIVQAVRLFQDMEDEIGIFGGESASYNRYKEDLSFNSLPSSFFSDLNTPQVLRPVLEYLKEDKGALESLESAINHELTHAYIEEKTGYDGKRKEFQAIDEAAAYAVGNITQESTAATEAYQVQGIDRNLMHAAQKVMLDIANSEDNKQQAITEVRGKAAEAIRKLQKNDSLDPIEVLREEDDRETRMIRIAAYAMEVTEIRSMSILEKLDLAPAQKVENFSQYLSTFDKANVSSRQRNIFPNKPRLKRVREDFEEVFESDEDWITSLELIKRGIQDLESLYDEGNLSEEEKKAVARLKSDLENAIEVYESSNYRIQEIIGKIFAEGNLTSPKVLEQKIEGSDNKRKLKLLLEKYLEVVQAGEKDNRQIFRALKKLHDDEEKSAQVAKEYSNEQEFKDIERMIKATEKAYSITKGAQTEFKESEEILETAIQRIDEL